jgi:hypothetical protein
MKLYMFRTVRLSIIWSLFTVHSAMVYVKQLSSPARLSLSLKGDMSLKNPVTPPGIDPGTVRLVAQRLNHYATPGPN